MADGNVRAAPKEHLTRNVIKDPAHPLADDEPLIPDDARQLSAIDDPNRF